MGRQVDYHDEESTYFYGTQTIQYTLVLHVLHGGRGYSVSYSVYSILLPYHGG